MKLLIAVLTFLVISIEPANENERFVRYYYPDGVIMAEGWVESAWKTGYWHQYYPDGALSSKGHYVDNERADYWYFYQPNGTLKREGHYKKGVMAGWWLYYDEDGIMEYKCQLKNGVKHGYCLKYVNEDLASAVKYEHGNRIKEWFSLQSFKKENNVYDLK